MPSIFKQARTQACRQQPRKKGGLQQSNPPSWWSDTSPSIGPREPPVNDAKKSEVDLLVMMHFSLALHYGCR